MKIEIDPAEATVFQDYPHPATYRWKTKQFKAYVIGDPVPNGVTWEMHQGGGSIDEHGVFHPPVTYGGVTEKSTILARSVTDKSLFALATVTYR